MVWHLFASESYLVNKQKPVWTNLIVLYPTMLTKFGLILSRSSLFVIIIKLVLICCRLVLVFSQKYIYICMSVCVFVSVWTGLMVSKQFHGTISHQRCLFTRKKIDFWGGLRSSTHHQDITLCCCKTNCFSESVSLSHYSIAFLALIPLTLTILSHIQLSPMPAKMADTSDCHDIMWLRGLVM